MGEPEYGPPAPPVEHDSPEAKVLVLREGDGPTEVVPDTAEARAKARQNAQERRAKFDHRLEGATARAGLLPRSLTASLAAGTTNLMLMQLLQQELVPATAKEAAEVAKITHAIFKEASGWGAGKDLTPKERGERLGEVDKLHDALAERAKQATDQVLGGAVPTDEPIEPAAPVVWEHDADPE